MGAVGNVSNRFSYTDLASVHTKQQLYQQFKQKENITIKDRIISSFSKEKLAEFMDVISQQQQVFYNMFGFIPINNIDTESRPSAAASADWYAGTETFSLRINISELKNGSLSYFQSTVTHEFAHLAVGYLAHQTLSRSDALKALYDTSSKERSSMKGFTPWNTQFAKDIVVKGLTSAKDSTYMQSIKNGKTTQQAINETMSKNISRYATASYHEAIAESVSRELTGHGNSTSKAVTNELLSRVRKIKK